VRRFKRSTKTTDAKLARRLADEWEAAEKLAGEGRLTESQCRKVIADLYERTMNEPLHFRTTREYLREWYGSKKGDIGHRTWLRYFQVAEEFLKHIGVKADRLLREITPKDIRSWRDELKKKGLSAPTVNGAIQVLRMPFKEAHDLGYIEISPCAASAVKLLKDEARNVSKDVFTPEQIAKLIEHADGDWKGVIMCAYFTGLRLKDVTELRWSAIDWSAQTIAVETRKTRKDVTLPLHQQFAAWLKKQTRGIGKAPVFPTLVGKVGARLSEQFQRIMERAGIRGRILREATGEGRKQSALSFHSLRHSFNAALANAGVGVEMRQELIGHSSLEMNRLYTHPDIEVKRKAIALLPKIHFA
jgi:integrase